MHEEILEFKELGGNGISGNGISGDGIEFSRELTEEEFKELLEQLKQG